MIEFPFPTEAYKYRPLRQVDEPISGWDVYALQTALNGLSGLDVELSLDGEFGKLCDRAVKKYQRRNDLLEDGIAGVITQRSIVLKYARTLRGELPRGLLKGQIEYESSFWLGNFSAARNDGTRDCGVAQRNTAYTLPIDGFDVPESIAALADQIAAKFHEYRDEGNVSRRRCWELAAGSWNAPAWTDRLARNIPISDGQRTHIENYITNVTAYMS